MASLRALSVGLSCIDHIWQVERFDVAASRNPASAYCLAGGGGAATAAVTVAKLGGYSALVTIHGRDQHGALARAELESYGVNCDGVIEQACPTMVSGVLVDSAGERRIIPYYPTALEDTAAAKLTAAGFQVVLSDGHFPRLTEGVLRDARARRIPVVASFGTPRHLQLSRYADYLLVSEECATAVLGRNAPEAAFDALQQSADQVVGITLGEQGFLYRAGGDVRHISAFPVEVIDTTGAGDVFHGAFAYAVASGWELLYCGLFASVTAALSCQALGGRAGIPSAALVNQLLERKTLKELNEQAWT
jgi:sulfofructose kinase